MPKFRTSSVPFEQTGQFDRLFTDYISGKENLRPFYAAPPEPAAIAASASKLVFAKADRELLAGVIAAQYKSSNLPVPEALLEQLQQENTYTVCTGHQLCIFTGPLYFIYKIATAIQLASELKKQDPSKNFIPVYWMASEDHDFDEISSVNLFGKTVTWTKPADGAVGRLTLDNFQPVLDELFVLLGESETAKQLRELLAASYAAGHTLADATRRLVHTLFEKHNLLLLDADDAALKKRFLPFLKAELQNNTNEQAVLKTSAALGGLGYAAQVTPRNVNLFYLGKNSRDRIEHNSSEFSLVNTGISRNENDLFAELDKHPEHFSPNVVLRPLYQQTIMPNVAYVGGPGELAYWLLYKKMFDDQGVFFPALVPRSFFMLLDAPTQERMQKLDVSVTDLFTPAEQLITAWVRRNAGDAADLSEQKNQLAALFEPIREKAAKTDATLVKSVEAELQKQVQALTALEGKLLKAEKQKQETATTQLRKLREKLFPNNALQERSDNVLPLLLRYEGFIEMVVNAASPVGTALTILEEEQIV